jgi:transcriptional regulator with XRE-family HTH domain
MELLPITTALRAAMKEQGETQESLAAKLAVSRPVVARLLTGQRPATTGTLDKVLAAMNLEMLVALRPKPSAAEAELQRLEESSVADLVRDLKEMEADLPPGQHEAWVAALLKVAKPLGPEWKHE